MQINKYIEHTNLSNTATLKDIESLSVAVFDKLVFYNANK